MKKILLALLLFISCVAEAQLVPTTTRNKIAMQHGRLRYYNGSAWVPLGDSTGGGGAIDTSVYNSDGTLATNRTISGNNKTFNLLNADAITFEGNTNNYLTGGIWNLSGAGLNIVTNSVNLPLNLPRSSVTTDSVLVRDGSGNLKTRAQSAFGGGGSVDTSNYTGIQTKPNTIRLLDSATAANTTTFRGTTTDYRPFKYVGGSTFTFKGHRGGYGITYDSTSAGDTILIAKVDTATLFPAVRATVSGGSATDTTGYMVKINQGYGTTITGTLPNVNIRIDTSHNSNGITTWNDVTRIVDSLNAESDFNQQISYCDAGGGTTLTASGVAITATGTATAVSVGTGSNYSNKTRLEYLVTVAATTAVAGWRQATAKFFFGNTSGQGGFNYTCYFGNATGASTTTNRCFVGMSSNVSAPTDVEPSTLTNMFGIGWDAADANIQFFNNDGTGTATKTDLGGSFTVPTTDRSVGYKLTMSSVANSSVVSYTLTNLNTGATASGSVSSDLPANTVFLAGRGYMSVGGTSSVIGIALIKQYIKSQL